MITRAQKARLGVFIVGSTALLVGAIALIAGLRLARDYDRYIVRYSDSVSGLEVGAAVKYHGLRVGKVDDMRIDDDDPRLVVVHLALNPGTPVTLSTRAEMGTVGITGLKYIELTEGRRGETRRAPGSEIPAGTSFIDRITGRAEEVARRADELLRLLTDMLDEPTRLRLQTLVASADDLALELRDTVRENRETFRTALQHARDLLDSARFLVDTLGDGLDETMADIKSAVADLKGVLDRDQLALLVRHVDQAVVAIHGKVQGADVKGTLTSVRDLATRAVGVLDNIDLTVVKGREGLFASLDYLLEGLENFAEFARMVRENPAILLRGPQEEERQLP